MKAEAPLRAHRRLLWMVLLPLTGVAAAASVAAVVGIRGIPLAPAMLGAFVLTFFEGVLVAQALPRQRALETRAMQVEAVCNLIRKAGASLDLQEVLDSITRLTVQAAGVRGCSIKLLDPSRGRMSVRSIAGLRRQVAELSAEAAESIATKSLLDGRPVLVEGAAQSDFPELDGESESLICVPLRHEAQVIGALCVYGEKGGKLSPEMLAFLSRLGDLAVLSIQNAAVYETLKKIDEAKSWFLRKAAHELASPLSVIQAAAQNFLSGYLGELDPTQLASIERIRARAAGLSDVVADLLALARGKAHSSSERSVTTDIANALRETVEFYQPIARQKDLALFAEAPSAEVAVPVSHDEIHSVLANLLSNAIKYSPAGREVRVRLSQCDTGVVLSVADKGIGIPEAEKERLFSEFFRASNARSFTDSGTGLGLAIVKSIVDSAGGSLEVESAEGEGTTIHVQLPRAR
ncbi:MAG TPA: GAF domain-containing sensor histidine kinase [Spirochaetia bacterium]|nr:GAF domain-containing sensor histidine kinase [Spirochaetia bacterium]